MSCGERADIEHDLLFRPKRILEAHDARILRALGEAALIDIAVVGRRDARFLLRRTRLQFRGKLIHQWLDRPKPRVGIGILRCEIGDHPRVFAVAQPVVIIDAHTAELLKHLRLDRRNRGVARGQRLGRVGWSEREWQSACERNGAGSRETKCEIPSSGKPMHAHDLRSAPQRQFK